MFDVTTYGAVGDGVTDDAPAFRTALAAAVTAGGGKIYVPKGTYLFDSSVMVTLSVSPFVETPVCLPIEDDNISLVGDGVGVSVIRLADGADAKVVGFGHCKNNSIMDVEIDGNRNNQTTDGIPLYSFGNLENFTVRDVFVHHSIDYGIGLQHGQLKNILLENVLIEDTGQDGFDNKNHDGGDLNNRMSNVTVRRAGLNTALSGQTCIDLRGKWILNNINCLDYNHTSARCKSGIRLRPDNTSDGAVGGNMSVISGFYCKPSSSSGTIGVEVNAICSSVSAGVVEGAGVGVLVNNTENTVTGVVALTCGDGFVAEDSSTTEGDRNTFAGCVARGCTSGFKSSSPKNNFLGLVASSNTHGINLRNGSSNTVLSGTSTASSGNNLNKESAGLTCNVTGLYS